MHKENKSQPVSVAKAKTKSHNPKKGNNVDIELNEEYNKIDDIDDEFASLGLSGASYLPIFKWKYIQLIEYY